MATYEELYNIARGDVNSVDLLRKKVAVAATITAKDYLATMANSLSTERLSWTQSALQNPVSASESLFHYVLAANDSSSQAQILGASDAVVQTNVNSAVAALYP